MANWSLPTIDSLKVDVLDVLKLRDVDAITLAEGPTNPPVGAKRWNHTTKTFQEWSGTAWTDLIISLAGGGTGGSGSGGAFGTMAYQNSNNVAITGGTIVEAAIRDDAILARVGANETITGAWAIYNAWGFSTPANATFPIDINYGAIRLGGTNGSGFINYGRHATLTRNWYVGTDVDATFRFYKGTPGDTLSLRAYIDAADGFHVQEGAVHIAANLATLAFYAKNGAYQYTITTNTTESVNDGLYIGNGIVNSSHFLKFAANGTLHNRSHYQSVASVDSTALTILDSGLGGDNRRMQIGPEGTAHSMIRTFIGDLVIRKSNSAESMRFGNNGRISATSLINIGGDSTALVANESFTLCAGFGSPVSGRIFMGDGSGWRMHISARNSNVTKDIFSFYDTGTFYVSDPTNFSSGIALRAPAGTATMYLDFSTTFFQFRTMGGAPLLTLSTGVSGADLLMPTTGFIRLANGTADRPGIGFLNEQTSGMYYNTTNNTVEFGATFNSASLATIRAYKNASRVDVMVGGQIMLDIQPGIMTIGSTHACSPKINGHAYPYWDNTYQLGLAGTNRWTVAYIVSGVVTGSDIRVKNVQGGIDDSLDLLDSVNPLLAAWKTEPDKLFPTFSAQEIAEQIDAKYGTHITEYHAESDTWGMRYDRMIPVMWQMIKDLRNRLKTLEP